MSFPRSDKGGYALLNAGRDDSEGGGQGVAKLAMRGSKRCWLSSDLESPGLSTNGASDQKGTTELQ
jgi:hypothetical protein